MAFFLTRGQWRLGWVVQQDVINSAGMVLVSQSVAVVCVGPLGAGVEWLQVQVVAVSLVLEVHCAVALCGGSV